MSDIDDLRTKKNRLEDQLQACTDSLHAALIAKHPFKVGNILFATFKTFTFRNDAPPKTAVGMVRRVFVGYDDKVEMDVAVQLKSGKFHARNSWNVGYGPLIEKIADSEADLAQKEANRSAGGAE
jgi:hypothetical protein